MQELCFKYGAAQPKGDFTLILESSLPDLYVYHVHICAAWSSEAGDLLWEWTREQVLLAKVTVAAHT